MRLLYGYRWVNGRAAVDPVAATVVCAVLAWPARRKTGLGEMVVRSLLPDSTRDAVRSLVERIRSHASDYRAGRAHVSLRPDDRLILSTAPYGTSTPSCGSGPKPRRRPGCPPGRRRLGDASQKGRRGYKASGDSRHVR